MYLGPILTKSPRSYRKNYDNDDDDDDDAIDDVVCRAGLLLVPFEWSFQKKETGVLILKQGQKKKK